MADVNRIQERGSLGAKVHRLWLKDSLAGVRGVFPPTLVICAIDPAELTSCPAAVELLRLSGYVRACVH
jgi:hypothetical protein